MNTTERILIITEIAKRDANIGKTALMKFLYLLQTIYDVPLGYHFEIYTYGPYSQIVMSDIEFAEFMGSIQVSQVQYSSGIYGYRINVTDSGMNTLSNNHEIIDSYIDAINEVVDFFSPKSAKELELYSTIVFVTLSFINNGWGESAEEICTTVKNIKPHFSIEQIQAAYHDLDSNGILAKGMRTS